MIHMANSGTTSSIKIFLDSNSAFSRGIGPSRFHQSGPLTMTLVTQSETFASA
jgi:hypothetical protein